MIDIALLSCNRARITAQAIFEIARRTKTPHRLLVLDNGSEDGSQKTLRSMQVEGLIDRLVLSEHNYGVHWGHNQLLAMVKSKPWYICTDNDIIPVMLRDGLDWLSRLMALAQTHPDYGAIACRPHVLIGPPSGMFDGAPAIKEMSHVGAVLRLMQTEAVREAGGWDTVKHPKRNNEEWWICKRLAGAGYKVGYARDVRCIHLFGKNELGEDDWGYPADHDHKARGHRDISPRVNVFQWDRHGVDWETCE